MTPEPDGSGTRGTRGTVPAGASADAVRRLLPDRTVAGVERRVSTDQANLSIAVDDAWLVKWFARPVRRGDLAVVDHLAAVGFAHMPSHVGAVTGDGDEVVAVVSELVLGATDGWVWYVDDVLAWIDGRLPLEPLVATAARLGAITAELHLALASAGTVTTSIGPLRDAVGERRRQAVEHTTGEVGERLRDRLPRIDAALAALDAIDGVDGVDGVAVQRIHGDLHAGQFLRAGERLLVVDFDGDPMTASADRLVQQPVERDLAALLQSIDHVARVANKRRPDADVTRFVDAAIDAAERAYRERHTVDDRLLWPLRVAQELHEYAYATLHLPVWTYVPDAAMQALFPVSDTPETPDTPEAAPALGITGATDV